MALVDALTNILWFAGLCAISTLFLLMPGFILMVRHLIMVRLFGSDAPASIHLGTGEIHAKTGNRGPGQMRPHPDFPLEVAGRTVWGELGDPGDPVRLYLRVQLRVELPCQIAMQRASRTLYMFRNLPQGSVSMRARACLPSGGPANVSPGIDGRFITRASAWPPARWLIHSAESSFLALPPTVSDVIGGRDRLLLGMEGELLPDERQAIVEGVCRLADHIEHALRDAQG